MIKTMQEQQSLFYLQNAIKNYGLDQDEVAKILFPNISNPYTALKRLLKGQSRLLVDQLEILAQYAGVSVPTLYEAGCNMWHDESEPEVLCFLRGAYKVSYDYVTSKLTVLIHDKVLFDDLVASDLTTSTLMSTVEQIIEGTYHYK